MKKFTSVILVAAFVITSAGISLAASGKCTVTAVEDNQVILDCGNKAAKFEVGTKVKIKSMKKKAIEGC